MFGQYCFRSKPNGFKRNEDQSVTMALDFVQDENSTLKTSTDLQSIAGLK